MAGPSRQDALRPRRPGGMGRGAALAIVVHVGLIVAIAFGVNWRSSEPTGATAELWAAVPQVAAPAATPEPPAPPPPKPAPEPKVEPKVEPPAPPKPDPREAEIALEKAKEQREKQERQEREQREQREKAEAAKKRQQQEQADKLARDKAAAEKAAAEKAERAAKAEQAEAERIAKLREDNLKRMMGQAGATGGPTSQGSAARDAGPSASYAGRIVARVKPNIVFTENVPASTRAEVEVRAAPDGTIVGRRLVKSSGDKGWDDAVLRAIDRTEVLPRDTDGRVPPVITIGFTPS